MTKAGAVSAAPIFMERQMDENVKAAIIALADKNGGLLQPEEVVNAARDPQSPLHTQFEWNVEKAAEQHWLATACQLIRKVRVVVITTELTVPILAPLFGRNADAGGYATLDYLRQEGGDLARKAAIMEFQKAAAALRHAQRLAIQLGLGAEAVATIAALVGGVKSAQDRHFSA
jgi:hypothetical protein